MPQVSLAALTSRSGNPGAASVIPLDETYRAGFSCPNGARRHMDTLSGYATRPFPFVLRYLRQRLASHVVIMSSVVAAVACSVGTQYGVKYLVDGLSGGPDHASN